MRNYSYLLILLLFQQLSVFAQQKYPKNYFRPPLQIPLYAAGTFAELRPNHFHSGLDIKTNGQEGLAVLAAAPGFVSRIRTQAGGFGQAVYINHPNGYTTVYGHLRDYNSAITKYLRAAQYKNESYEQDLFPSPGELSVPAGSIIGYSGNTGSSGGPHLHFEIRETRSEQTVDPLLFNLGLVDHTQPIIKRIRIVPVAGTVNGATQPVLLGVIHQQSNFSLALPKALELSGDIGIEIDAVDMQDLNYNENGINRLELKKDGELVYGFYADAFSFSETKYINAHTNFSLRKSGGPFMRRCYVLPGDKLSLYYGLKNKGILSFTDNGKHEIELSVWDGSENKATVKFELTGKVYSGMFSRFTSNQNLFYPFKTNEINTPDYKLEVPEGSLYDTMALQYSKRDGAGYFSDIHQFNNTGEALHKPATLSIKTIYLPANLKSKACIVELSTGKSYVGGHLDGDYFTAKIKSFGTYAVFADTEKPTIKLHAAPKYSNYSKSKNLQILISDNLSGIKSYRATVDGKWILMEYDAKSARLTHTFDEHIKPGLHKLQVVVLDHCGNENIFQSSFVR